jgi:hypothetical protein
LSALFYLIIYCLVGSFNFTFHFSGFHLSFLASCLFSVLGKKKLSLVLTLLFIWFSFLPFIQCFSFPLFSPFLILVFFCSYRLTDISCPLKTLLHAFFSLFIFFTLFVSFSLCLSISGSLLLFLSFYMFLSLCISIWRCVSFVKQSASYQENNIWCIRKLDRSEKWFIILILGKTV